jgi:hypothetical protein
MASTAYHFYAGGNTARGFVSLLPSSLQKLERLYVVRGGAGLGKLCGLRSLGERLAATGLEVWFIHSPSDAAALDGLIVPELKAGILDDTTPSAHAPELAGIAVHDVNLGEACEQERLLACESAIESLKNEISLRFESAYASFAEALRVHDDWEQIYIGNMDFAAADRLTQRCEHELFGDRRKEGEGRAKHRFLGAATPQGAIDCVPNLTEGLRRYLIKGRPGSGKSTMLKKLALTAAERGFDAEIYHCGFDPNSLDMIIVRELGFAIFDSTAPHEYFPDRPGDQVVDMYSGCIQPGTDEAHSAPLSALKEQYGAKMKQSIQLLAEARSLQDRLEELYAESLDSARLDRILAEFEQDIARLAAVRS